MKKLFLLCVTLFMLAVPSLAAEPDAEVSPDEVSPASAEEWSGLTAQTAERADWALQRMAARERCDQTRAEAEADRAELMGSESATVTVTVCLPNGVTASAGDSVYVYLRTPAVKDATGRVTAESDYVKGSRVEFASGASQAEAVLSHVPGGAYIIQVETCEIARGRVLNQYENYFSADGSLASSQYVAGAFSVPEGGNVSQTVTLPAAECSVSGTLTFSAPLTKDIKIELYCYNEYSYEHSDIILDAKKGDRTLPFSVGTSPGYYTLDFYNRTSGGSYYSLNYEGELGQEHDRVYYCALSAGIHVSGLSILGDALLDEDPGSGTDTEYVNVELRVTLPEAAAQAAEYALVAAYQVNDDYISSEDRFVTVTAGQASFSGTLSLEKGLEYALGYRDLTDCESYTGPSNSWDVRYLAEDGGVTSLFEKAKKFRFDADAVQTLSEPDCVRVTGRVDRAGFNSGKDVTAYAWAVLPDEEIFCGRVLLKSEDSAPFTIYIPQSRVGQTFQLYAGLAEGSSNDVIDLSIPAPVSKVLSGDNAVGTLSVSPDYVTSSGMVSLPPGVKAPAAGQALNLSIDYLSSSRYVIPGGKRSVFFSFDSYLKDDSPYIEAVLAGDLPGVFHRVYQFQPYDSTESPEDWRQTINLELIKSAVITGSVSLASGIQNVGVRMRFNASFSEDSVSAIAYPALAILKGQNSTAFGITVPAGELRFSLILESSTEGRVADDTLHMDSNWNISKDWVEGPTVTGNHSGLHFTLDVFDSAAETGIISVYSSYEEGVSVMDGLRQDGWVSAKCTGPCITVIAAAALYDADGRVLELCTDSYFTLSRSGNEVYFYFDQETAAAAASLKIFLLDRETLCPLTASVTF